MIRRALYSIVYSVYVYLLFLYTCIKLCLLLSLKVNFYTCIQALHFLVSQIYIYIYL